MGASARNKYVVPNKIDPKKHDFRKIAVKMSLFGIPIDQENQWGYRKGI